MAQETMSFQAEVKQLLQLMIHSLYSHKEIFLRELISNASDAADKLRFEAIADSTLFEDDPNLRIRVSFDKAARTISIDDNGIGMSRDEAISHLGTIARSGTKEFFSKLSGDQQKDAALIGQFGVGFYSGFIVADKITVETRRAGLPASEGVRWESAGEGEFAVETIERPARGTTITLHLREGEDELLSGYQLRSIIRKYSDHVALPILMKKRSGMRKRARPSRKTRTRPSIRRARCGRGQKARSATISTSSFISISRTIIRTRLPGRITALKGAASTRSCFTCRLTRRSIFSTASGTAV